MIGIFFVEHIIIIDHTEVYIGTIADIGEGMFIHSIKALVRMTRCCDPGWSLSRLQLLDVRRRTVD
jgi:hypothetical protein